MPATMTVSRRRFLALSGTATTLTAAAAARKPRRRAKTLLDHGGAADRLGLLSEPLPLPGDAVTDLYLDDYGAYP